MKWTSIKSIMVWFLIAMNLLMLGIIAIISKEQSIIPEEVISSAVSVMKQSGFEIKREIFPDRYVTIPSYSTQFYSASDLSELFFQKQVAFRTAGKSLVATEGNAVLTVNDNHFIYENGSSAISSESVFSLTKALKKKGFDMKGAVYDKKSGCFYRMYNGVNLFNMYIEVNLDNSGEICYMKAQWPKKLTPGERKRISFIESTQKLKTVFPEGGKIENIELGYSLRSAGGENFTFTPSWRVQINDEIKILE